MPAERLRESESTKDTFDERTATYTLLNGTSQDPGTSRLVPVFGSDNEACRNMLTIWNSIFASNDLFSLLDGVFSVPSASDHM